MAASRIMAIGDIHGQHLKLEKMLARLAWQPNRGDTLIFLGDFIDYGPQSAAVVNTVSDLVTEYPLEVIALMGDHDRMFLDFISGKTNRSISQGQEATVRSYQAPGAELTCEQLLFFRNLYTYYETDSYIFVHAGLRPGLSLAAQTPGDLVGIQDDFLNSDYDFGRTVVFGHTPQNRKPLVAPGRLGLDTGAALGGPLTAVVLPEMKFISVE